ncbi:phosphoglycerate dehydrogenase [Fuerstiella marisgermanici]|uniref:D-3-phosphoglycerate dehydrogenase n=1 Tax=Fuerstiella marisgermanici TaxID=1891926 RepID=A0A1P8WAR7_9PLAN|nr:phosphoglycerate dehydrogenase [Fuerstiella marisgermanici]APZ91182.1 D-3-phosphoglycerate dehydrogenase [Fuerstiella marisgermanici]
MYRVLITDGLHAAGMKVLNDADNVEPVVKPDLTPEQLKAELQNVEGIIIRSKTTLTADLLEGQKRLKVIVRAGVGTDNIDSEAATKAGILVMNTPTGNTTSTAEHAFAMMLALSRNIAPACATMKAGRWDKKLFQGSQLAGKTLAVIGLGRIGVTVAKRAKAFEMRVLGYDPFYSAEKAAEHGIEYFDNVDDIVKECDYLTVHTPLVDATRGIINAKRLATMKKGARLINCARGGIIDEGDLADAIESGHIGGAAMDVFVEEPPTDRRLVDLPQVLATPHLGASTEEAQEMVAVEAAEIITDYLLNNEIRYAINMAPVSGAEMEDLKHYLALSYRLGLLSAQMIHGQSLKGAEIDYRGEAADRKTRLMTSAFAAGLLEGALDDGVNIINATSIARSRGIDLTEVSSGSSENFASMISISLNTDSGTFEAAGTIFGHQFLRLVKLDKYCFEAFLDGVLLVYRHRDVPGLIGYIGTILGKHNVNIANMALGRQTNQPGGDSVAVLNLDSEPSAEALAEVLEHAEVSGVDIVRLPPAGASLPWVGGN